MEEREAALGFHPAADLLPLLEGAEFDSRVRIFVPTAYVSRSLCLTARFWMVVTATAHAAWRGLSHDSKSGHPGTKATLRSLL
jgi:hypothetical protein